MSKQLRKFTFDEAQQRIAYRRPFSGYDSSRTYAHIWVDDDNQSKFIVQVQSRSRSYNDYIDNLNRDDLANALHSLYFHINDSFWFEPMEISRAHDQEGYIYLIQLHGTPFYKIGLSVDPVKRFKAFSVDFPIPITILGVYRVPRVHDTERMIHEDFIFHWHNGEWFEFDEDELNRFFGYMEPISVRIV